MVHLYDTWAELIGKLEVHLFFLQCFKWVDKKLGIKGYRCFLTSVFDRH